MRKLLRALGYPGYRLHRRDLPGKPDISFIGKRKAIFVHGCFWHGHSCKEGLRRPKSNQVYWTPKINGNHIRTQKNIEQLRSQNWAVLVIWECEMSGKFNLEKKLIEFMRA